MNNQDLKLVKDALGRLCGKVTLETNEDCPEARRFVVAAWRDRNGEPFAFYAYQLPRKKKIYFTDAGAIARTLHKSGMEIKASLLQELLKSYDLMLTSDLSVVESSDRPMSERIAVLLQAWAAADGVLRMWARKE